MVSVNEFTPSETACTETRVLSASLKSPKREFHLCGGHLGGKVEFSSVSQVSRVSLFSQFQQILEILVS